MQAFGEFSWSVDLVVGVSLDTSKCMQTGLIIASLRGEASRKNKHRTLQKIIRIKKRLKSRKEARKER